MSGTGHDGPPAVFVDRDGTVIEETEYLSDPASVRFLDGAPAALQRFQDAGYRVVIITNQSGIARGYYEEADYRRVAAEVARRLGAAGVMVTGSYHCPHHPDFTGPCDCRKPATGLFRQAAAEHGLDLRRSVYIGDRLRDVEPGLELGGRAILVRTGYGDAEAAAGAPAGVRVVADLVAAAAAVLDPP